MSETIRTVPVFIYHETGFYTPKLPNGYKWEHRTDIHPDKVTLTVKIVCTKNPLSALIFRLRNSGKTTLVQEIQRGHEAGTTATFMQKTLYNGLFPQK